jgi:hypothetical protein
MLEVTMFLKPTGRKQKATIQNISEADAEFFQENNIAISMEDMFDRFVIYADVGIKTSDGEPDEVMYLTSPDESCIDAMNRLRELCEEILNDLPKK